MKLINPSDRRRTITSHKQTIAKQVLLGKDQVPHITQFAIASLNPSQEVEPHSHQDMYEVFLVADGSGKLNVNNELFKISKGTMFVIEPNELHSITNQSDSKNLVLEYFGVTM